MTSRQMDSKRNWKATGYDYDHYINDDLDSCLYCLSALQVEALLAAIESMGWKSRWFSDTQALDEDKIDDFTNKIRRVLMSGCGCDDPNVTFRYAVDGTLEQSSDGGTTWVTAPKTSDERSKTPLLPPIDPTGGENSKCYWADSAAEYLKQGLIDQLTEGATVRDVLAVIAGILAGLFTLAGAPIAVQIAAPIAVAIVAAGVSAVTAAFTDDLWQRVKCLIKSHMQADGSFTDGDVDAIYNGLTETGIALFILQRWIAANRGVGLTNAARSGAGSADADCSPCDEFCGDDWFWDQEGAIITYNSDLKTVTVESVNGGAFYYMALQGDHCCAMEANVTTGAISHFFGRWNSCEDFDPDYAHEDNPGWTSTAFGSLTGTGSAIFGRSVTPFTVTITYAS